MNLLFAGVAVIFMMATFSPPCFADQKSEAINTLQKTHPKIKWQPSSAVIIDINVDGVKDVAVLGFAEKAAAVGIVLGATTKSNHIKILEFARDGQVQRGICGKTAKLLVEKQSQAPKEALEEFPEGYRICKKCFEIAVDDGLCDPIHIYWNHKTKELDWWRA